MFQTEGFICFSPPYRLDRTDYGGGQMFFVRENTPSKLLPNVNSTSNREYIC